MSGNGTEKASDDYFNNGKLTFIMSIARNKRTKPREARGRKEFFGRIHKNWTEAAASVLAVCIIAVLLSLSGILPADTRAAGGAERPQDILDCISENPGIPEETCWNFHYNEKAVTENDASYCAMIKNDDMKAHCERYF